MKAFFAVLSSLFALSAVADDLKKQTSSVIEILSQVKDPSPFIQKELAGWKNLEEFLSEPRSVSEIQEIYFDNLHRFGRLLTMDDPRLIRMGHEILGAVPWGKLSDERLYEKTRRHLEALFKGPLKHPLASTALTELQAHTKMIPVSEGEAIRRRGGSRKSEHSEERQYGPSTGCVLAFVAMSAVTAVAAGAYLLTKYGAPPRFYTGD